MLKEVRKPKAGPKDTNAFETVWKVEAGGMVKFHSKGSYTVDWGDGCFEHVETVGVGWNAKHIYVDDGEYTVSITDFPRTTRSGGEIGDAGITRFAVAGDYAHKLIEIKQWGAAQWEDMQDMFRKAEHMVCSATDTPDLSKNMYFKGMFQHCRKFNSTIAHWQINPDANPLGFMLADTPSFTQDLSQLKIPPQVNVDMMFGMSEPLSLYIEKQGLGLSFPKHEYRVRDLF